jgi:hypothetical protein
MRHSIDEVGIQFSCLVLTSVGFGFKDWAYTDLISASKGNNFAALIQIELNALNFVI